MKRYEHTKLTKSKTTRQRFQPFTKYSTTIYQKIPLRNDDLYIITTEGDRLDLLANQYYNDPSLWWYIAQANHINVMNVPNGTSLRIPLSIQYAKGT